MCTTEHEQITAKVGFLLRSANRNATSDAHTFGKSKRDVRTYVMEEKIKKTITRLCARKENKNEKNLPTQEKTKKQSARFPRKNENNRRTQNIGEKKKQGSSFSFGIIRGNWLEVYLQT